MFFFLDFFELLDDDEEEEELDLDFFLSDLSSAKS
jgi:hypothetical protein